MDKRKLYLSAFVLLALTQLFVPYKMIADREDVIAHGVPYKFRSAPVDPNDPFRGKYITLRFDDKITVFPTTHAWERESKLYVLLAKDADGFATIKRVSAQQPDANLDYVEAKVDYVTNIAENKKQTLHINYPFNRFYMEESKAEMAEGAYNESLADSNNITYALVYVKKGKSVLTDVLINDTSVCEIIKRGKKIN